MLLLPILLAFAMGAPAAAAEPLKREYRLTPEQVEQVLADAQARKDEARDKDRDGPPISGEISVSVGTDGYRSIAGTIEVPGKTARGAIWFGMDRMTTRTEAYDAVR
jgi:hypothetical protein